MQDVSVKTLLEAGVHFGHQVSRWDPRMKPFIFMARGGIHIIDLDKVVPLLRKACQFIYDQVARGGQVLFVGTKPQAQEVIERESQRVGMYYVNQRWLGGMLTNYRTIKQSSDKLKGYYTRVENGEITKLPKKEQIMWQREAAKMEKSLGGIRDMDQLPAAVILVDPSRERIAKLEANRLRIPVVALTDTNCNPNGIDFVIPGNDDAIRSIQLVIGQLADACAAGVEKRQELIRKDVADDSKPGTETKGGAAGIEERKMGGRGRAYVGKERPRRERTPEGTNPEAPKIASA